MGMVQAVKEVGKVCLALGWKGGEVVGREGDQFFKADCSMFFRLCTLGSLK